MSHSIHTQRPGRGSTRGVLAGVALIVMVVGVPVALASVPAAAPAHFDIGTLWRAALHQHPGDVRLVTGWLGRAAVLVAWIGWAWLTLCVALEVRAWLTGRSTVRLPGSRSMQWAAAVLVGTAFALGTTGRAPVHFAQPGVIHAPATPDQRGSGAGLDRVPITPSATGVGGPTFSTRLPVLSDGPMDVAAPSATSPVTREGSTMEVRSAVDGHTVRHRVSSRETLWSIAGDRLGEARRWREIAELNYDVVQHDGSRLAADHWILPGWELVLPEIDSAPVPPSAAPTELVAPVSVAQAVSVPRPVPSRAMTDGVGSSDPAAAPADEHGLLDGHRPLGLPVVPLGAGIVGVGVADLVDRLRRVQQRHRNLGARIRLPGPDLRAFEQRIRVGDGRDDLDVVEAAVEAWSVGLGHGPSCRRLQLVTVTGTHVRLTFDAPLDEVPPRWSPSDHDPATVAIEKVTLERTGTRHRGARQGFAAPALVTVGRTGDELVLVNLEGVGSLVFAGDVHANESAGRAMALELATSRWAGDFDLFLIGFGTGMDRGERVSVLADAGPVSADLSWRKLTTGMRLDEVGSPRADTARRLGGGAEWQPVVVVCGPGVPSDDVEAMIALGDDGRSGIAIVAMAGSGAPRFDGAVVVRPGDADPQALSDVLGTRVAPQRVAYVEMDQVSAVIEAAAVIEATAALDYQDTEDIDFPDTADIDFPDGVEAMTDAMGVHPIHITSPQVDLVERTAARVDVRSALLGAGDQSHRRHQPVHATARAPSDEPEVEVAVLGPIEIRGAARGFTRAWATELVVYLAMHPGGAANDNWATALWPERLMAPSSLHSTASVARRSLGKSRDGSDHLPRSHGRLALGSSVSTDWIRFQELAMSDDPERWRSALSLVRGRPFEGMRSTDWSILDGTAPAIESAVVDLSGRLAGARLQSGDARGAEWAARRGLLVSPYDERLYRMLLRAADAAGNPGGVEAVMTELVRVVADEVEPIESVHPSTLALYRSLSRRAHRGQGVPVRP